MTSLSLPDIGLKLALLKAVERKAKHHGQTTPEYVRAIIQRDQLAEKSFDEILRPVREDFQKSGITEDQLDQIVERARSAAHRKPRKGR